jgi:hypothetical protein
MNWKLWNHNRVNLTGWVLTCIGPCTWKPQYLLTVVK